MQHRVLFLSKILKMVEKDMHNVSFIERSDKIASKKMFKEF